MATQYPHFGSTLRHYRYRAGLSQAALAARAGLSEAAISALERGARVRPYPHTLDQLASALNLTPAERAALADEVPSGDGRAADAVPAHATPSGDTGRVGTAPSPGALPVPLTSFVGRERELAGAAGLLAAGCRLLTLTGPGGAGKTRLAIEGAQAVAHSFPAGVWFVDLAPLPPHEEIVGAVAATLGVRDVPGRDLQAGILAALSSGQTLLVLDNCEHVIDACAALVARLLQASPRLTVLTTSREPLRVAGEQIYAVPPLGLPPDDGSFEVSDPEALTRFAAIRLFVDRARAVLPGFALTAEQAAATVEICRRLDGLPLAIELAAARIRTLTPLDLAGRLADRFRLVAGRARDRLPRHQTLRALIDWSHDLLASEEQVLLRRLGVFAGGWDLAAVEAICRAIGNRQWGQPRPLPRLPIADCRLPPMCSTCWRR
ncbi:MAG: helix-turn-helix domain-containing protein [Dehalococcoidia bacterium]